MAVYRRASRVLIPLLFALACSGDERDTTSAAPPAPMAAARARVDGAGLDRDRTLGAFLAAHWRLPVPPQGDPPAHFSEAERSLDPDVCGACHPEQRAQWGSSLHAAAFSAGFAGQLMEGHLATPLAHRNCQSCHAPLAEQQLYDSALQTNGLYDPALQSKGVVCAACHVRARRHYGPPRRPDAAPAPEPVPHGGFEARDEYLESRFCAECHQFFDDAGVNGKPLENTYAEWLQSPQAAAGRSCQDCHMPERKHLWRGIHDPEMVRQAVDVELVAQSLDSRALRAALVLLNRDVGHAFPSYLTPRVFMAVFQVDAAGEELPGTRVEAVIAREVDLENQVEVFDTRVLPGESVKLDYAVDRAAGAVALVARVRVDPDHHYRGVFASLQSAFTDARARELMLQAARGVADSQYVLSELRKELPG